MWACHNTDMNKKVFLERWLDLTLALILVTFIGVWGEVQKFSAEQDVLGSESMAASTDQLTAVLKAR